MTSRRRPNGRCAVCQNVERTRAELLIAGGASVKAVAKKFGVDYWSLWRHWRKHVPDEHKARLAIGPVARAALAARVADESQSVLDHFKSVRAGLYELFEAALNAGDRNGGALLAGRLHENLNGVARLTGELAQSPLIQQTTNIVMMPAFASLQAALIRALAEHPEARAAVIAEFRKLELGQSPAAAAASAPALLELEHGRAP